NDSPLSQAGKCSRIPPREPLKSPASSAPRYPASSTWLLTSKGVRNPQERLQSPLMAGGKNLEGFPVRRSPGELQLHPGFFKLGLVGTLINSAVQGRKPEGGISEPILITTSGI